MCGIDNALGRQALDQVGFDLVVEAGLGHGYRDFRTLRLHTLPNARRASDIWKSDVGDEAPEERSAYQRMIKEGADRCGVTLLAGKAVGAPFVGTVAASLALTEILRLLHGGHVHQLLDLDLQSVEHRTVIENASISAALNPGCVPVAA